MKLSDIKGERTLDVIADLIPPVAAIAADPEAAKLFAGEGNLASALPALIRSHRADLLAVLAALRGADPADYGRDMSLPSLLEDLLELASDEDLLRLFT